MARSDSKISVELFATCPQSKDISSDCYARSVADVARWSEQCGCKGILVYTDNSIVDPWLVSQIIIENTKNLCPLVAIQPVYMHPYSVAKMVASFGFLYGRRIYLNLVAGGFKTSAMRGSLSTQVLSNSFSPDAKRSRWKGNSIRSTS